MTHKKSYFPTSWEQRKVGDHCDMFNGDRSSKYPNAQDMVSDGIPFINAGDLEDGHVNLVTCNKITREKYDDLGGAKLQLGDIVYCLRGTLGKNAYIDNFNEGTVASSLVALRPKDIDGRYLFHVLNSDIEYKQRVVHDEGAAQPNLSAKSVSEFIMPVPDIEEQKKISEFLDGLNNLITLHQRKVQKKNPVSLPDSLHIPYSIFTCLFLYSPNSRRCCGLLFQPRQRRIDKYTELYHTHYDKYQRLQQYTLP